MKRESNKNLTRLVKILSDGQYHDGTGIGRVLNMTRSAVWKLIKKLQAYGLNIDSIKGKGYSLQEPLILLEVETIKRHLKDKVDIYLFESVDSTNDYLKNGHHQNLVKICLAEQQTAGKGRLNRYWYSPFAKNIYLSCVFHFAKDVSSLAGLSLVTSLAILKTIQAEGIKEGLFVKWPNDVFYKNKKLAGSLIEIQAESHGHSVAIIGIGVNVNMLNIPEKNISQDWTSLQKILGQYIDRNELCARLINHLFFYLREFDQHGFSPFMDDWMKVDCLANKTITLKTINTKIKGKVTGIDPQGHLLLRLTNGQLKSFSSGDTSIIK